MYVFLLFRYEVQDKRNAQYANGIEKILLTSDFDAPLRTSRSSLRIPSLNLSSLLLLLISHEKKLRHRQVRIQGEE